MSFNMFDGHSHHSSRPTSFLIDDILLSKPKHTRDLSPGTVVSTAGTGTLLHGAAATTPSSLVSTFSSRSVVFPSSHNIATAAAAAAVAAAAQVTSTGSGHATSNTCNVISGISTSGVTPPSVDPHHLHHHHQAHTPYPYPISAAAAAAATAAAVCLHPHHPYSYGVHKSLDHPIFIPSPGKCYMYIYIHTHLVY